VLVGVFSEVRDSRGCKGESLIISAEVGLASTSYMSFRTFLGLKGHSPVFDHLDLMLQEVIATLRA
jgi:hypothetical protein